MGLMTNFKIEPIHRDEGLVTVYWVEPDPERPGLETDGSEAVNGDFSIYADGTVKVITDEKVTVFPGALIKRIEAPGIVSAYEDGEEDGLAGL